MQRAIIVVTFFSVTGAVYFGLSVDEYGSPAPAIALSCIAVLAMAFSLLRAFGKLGGPR
jgi:hypothetical protein